MTLLLLLLLLLNLMWLLLQLRVLLLTLPLLLTRLLVRALTVLKGRCMCRCLHAEEAMQPVIVCSCMLVGGGGAC